MDWQKVKSEFAPDGGLRDIYVLETSDIEWQILLDFLSKYQPPPIYLLDGKPAILPNSIKQIFDNRTMVQPSVSMVFEGMLFNSYFFAVDTIEFDLDPSEVNCEERLKSTVNFIKLLGKITKKNVILTPENHRTNPILTYSVKEDKVTFLS